MTYFNKNIPIILILIIITIVWGCSHKTLTIFFDGVPEVNDSLKTALKQNMKKTDTIPLLEMALGEPVADHFFHPPFAKKKCGLCHDAEKKGKLIEPQPGLCYQCHETYDGKFQHGPVVSGNCTACHSPHTANNPKLLLRIGEQLCFNCHEPEMLRAMEQHEKIDVTPCTDCHNPHGGNKRYFLN